MFALYKSIQYTNNPHFIHMYLYTGEELEVKIGKNQSNLEKIDRTP